MTKDTYFDMCEQLGSQPIEEEIPLEMSEFPVEVVQAWHVYDKLPTHIDSFSGTYLGKSIEHTKTILDLMNIERDELTIFFIVCLIDRIDKELINNNIKKEKSKKG